MLEHGKHSIDGSNNFFWLKLTGLKMPILVVASVVEEDVAILTDEL